MKLIKRLLKVEIYKFVLVGIFCHIVLVKLFCSTGIYNYRHIPRDTIDPVLYRKVHPAVTKRELPSCMYESILSSNASINTSDVGKSYSNFSAVGIENGSYIPLECNPLFSVALLVTYRDRDRQLYIFLRYMHTYLRKQNIHYKIYVIEQADTKPWNKGLLYNIGARQAIADDFPCLILHDVDLLPLDESNLYVCAEKPRHMSATIDKFRYVLPYECLFGGVVAIRSDQYKEVNGFSNRFLQWGGEDDDFFTRFPKEMSRYTMMRHQQAPMNKERHRIMTENERGGPVAIAADGLSTASAGKIQLSWHPLYTLIAVES